ncbi:MAG: LPS export ABC transporter periplasmic protein LptC [Alphaproteobacteria bacterium]|nr:LPS export ABC transporter periplasmic protein LptC [Alphaproteobacteria bacterium]
MAMGGRGAAGKGSADDAPLAANLVGGRGWGKPRGGPGVRPGRGYSRFVVGMKFLLPFLALILIALVIIWPRLNSEETFRIGFSLVRLSDKTEPGMDNARYVGVDDKRQPYTVTADLARLDSDSSAVSMEMPKADLTLEDGTWLVLTADNGRFLQKEDKLELEGGVNLFHDTGYEMETQQLIMDLKKNTAVSNTPVHGHGPFGEIKSQGLRLIDKGQVIHFTGPARLTLYASRNDGAGGGDQK